MLAKRGLRRIERMGAQWVLMIVVIIIFGRGVGRSQYQEKWTAVAGPFVDDPTGGIMTLIYEA
jgi:hypothetical protein